MINKTFAPKWDGLTISILTLQLINPLIFVLSYQVTPTYFAEVFDTRENIMNQRSCVDILIR